MPRKKSFDEGEVLAQIARYFWRHGFYPSGMDRLCELTSLKKSSMYNAYGGKEALFRRAIDWYAEMMLGEAARILAHEEPVSVELGRLLRAFLIVPGTSTVSRGCMVVNSALELADTNPGLHEYACEKAELVHEGFARYFEVGQAEGRLAHGVSAKQLALYMTNVLRGLWVQARIDPDPEVLESIIDTSIAFLPGLAPGAI